MDARRATFAAGCFWGVEAAFRQLEGVVDAVVGYTGGHTVRPTYREVCSGKTGHAEAVQLEYDPSVVSYKQLLDTFWKIHDPTQRNRQGPDIGTQYRSAIFFHDDGQEETARESLLRLETSGRLRRRVATQVEPASEFYRAEDYHQGYFEKQGIAHCAVPQR